MTFPLAILVPLEVCDVNFYIELAKRPLDTSFESMSFD